MIILEIKPFSMFKYDLNADYVIVLGFHDERTFLVFSFFARTSGCLTQLTTLLDFRQCCTLIYVVFRSTKRVIHWFRSSTDFLTNESETNAFCLKTYSVITQLPIKRLPHTISMQNQSRMHQSNAAAELARLPLSTAVSVLKSRVRSTS